MCQILAQIYFELMHCTFKDTVSKEVVIESTKGIASDMANKLFSNDLSWIKPKDVALPNKKDSSEIYDQLIDEGRHSEAIKFHYFSYYLT
jgi:hypothetical protein